MVSRGVSPTLGRSVVQYTDRGYLVTDDGVRYDRGEIIALRGAPPALIEAVHNAKRILQGTVVSGPGRRRP